MHNWPLIAAAGACLAGAAAWAGDEPADESSDSAWNVRVEQDESKSQKEETTETMRMRVFDRHSGRYYRDPRPGYVVDVETVWVTCPDGYTQIQSVNVGGKDFDIEAECDKARSANKITIDGKRIHEQADERSDERPAE